MLPKEPLQIVNTDHIDGDRIVVNYSNDTTAIYTTEQLAELTPISITRSEDVPKE